MKRTVFTKKALRVVYSDYMSTFQEILEKDAFISVHYKNIQILAIEIYDHIHRDSPTIKRHFSKLS